MDASDRAILARTNDVSTEAIAFRLRAARTALGRTQKGMAEELGIPNTTYGSYETADARAPDEVIRHFRRNHEISFDFLLNGEFGRLPVDLIDQIFSAMLEEQAKEDRKLRRG